MKYPSIRSGIGYIENAVCEVKSFHCGRCKEEFSIEIEYHDDSMRAEIEMLICPECFTTILLENPGLDSYFSVDLPLFSEPVH